MILNKIGDIGCQHLSKADWKNLNTLILCTLMIYRDGNKIEAGCSHLIKANWKNLTSLNLSTLTFIQIPTTLELLDAYI